MSEIKQLWDEVSKNFHEIENTNIALPLYESVCVTRDFKLFPVMLSRYKFCGKMLAGKKKIIEVGCNGGFKTSMIAQFCDSIHGIDFDEEQIAYAKNHFENEKVTFECADWLSYDCGGVYDGMFSLDVIEHIPADLEDRFIGRAVECLTEQGICIIGTPNITAAEYQSTTSKIGHINLYSHDRLKSLLDKYFYNTFLFGMNDEIVHCGFPEMCHYLIVMGVGPKK